jgi:predicted deacylase
VTDFEIAGMKVAPGELEFGALPVGQWRGGLAASIPVMVVHGSGEGPVLWVDACIHGNEVLNIEVIRRLMREEVDPQELRGTIVAVPVVNPFAFHVGHRGTPLLQDAVDITDVHGVFPGDPHGTLNDRLAHRVFSEMVKCDFIVNLHQNTAPAVPFTGVATCKDQQVLAASVALAEAFGLPLTEMKVDVEGTSSPAAPTGWPTLATLGAGIPTFIVELPPTGYIYEPSVQLGVRGLLNVLRHLKMLEGQPEPLPGLKVPPGRYGRSLINSDVGGLIHFRKDAGDWVDTGDTLAIIRDVYGDIVGEVEVPTQGYVRTLLFGPHNEAIYEGAIVGSILEVDPNRRYFFD